MNTITLESIIKFNGDMEPSIISNMPVEGVYLEVALTLVKPFSQLGGKERILSGIPVRITATFKDDYLESYTVGFTDKMTISKSVKTVSEAGGKTTVTRSITKSDGTTINTMHIQ